jgi:dethiobiotin synthetase
LLKSWFFTATDTGIGKTTVTAASARALKINGIDIGIMKPYASGIARQSGYKSDDVSILAEYAGISDPEDLVNPYFFPMLASPYAAASKLGVSIDTDIVPQKFEKLQTLHDAILVEGIGGILTPITKNYCVANLIKNLNLDTILVCSSKIGTVNHTLLSCYVCAKYGINIRGLVINEAKDGYNISDLQDELLNLSGVDTVCAIPYMKNPDITEISRIVKDSNLMSLLF